MDNRKYSRLPIDVIVEIQLDDESLLYGETADLSLDGAFVVLTPSENLKEGDKCKLVLIINNDDGWVRVEFNSRIAHKRQDGIGIRFEKANTAHHESFLKLLISGSSDVEKLLEELSQYPGETFSFSNQ